MSKFAIKTEGTKPRSFKMQHMGQAVQFARDAAALPRDLCNKSTRSSTVRWVGRDFKAGSGFALSQKDQFGYR